MGTFAAYGVAMFINTELILPCCKNGKRKIRSQPRSKVARCMLLQYNGSFNIYICYSKEGMSEGNWYLLNDYRVNQTFAN